MDIRQLRLAIIRRYRTPSLNAAAKRCSLPALYIYHRVAANWKADLSTKPFCKAL